MEVCVDASTLARASEESRCYGREILRGLLLAGAPHRYRLLSWPTNVMGSVDDFLAPLGRSARARLEEGAQNELQQGPWVLYSPWGIPTLEPRTGRSAPGNPPSLRVATLLGERPTPPSADGTTFITLTRSSLQSVASSVGRGECVVRWVPPGLGSSRPVAGSSQRVEVPDGDYFIAAGVAAAAPRESLRAAWRLLRAFRALRKLRAQKLRLVLLGGAPASLRQAAACLGLTKDVLFISARGAGDYARRRLIASAVAYVHVSRPDASWLVGAEAMRCGVPIVAPRTTFAEEVWGDSAILCAEGSVLELARGLQRLLSSSELRRALSRNGMSRGLAYSWEASASGLLDCFALAGKRDGSGAAVPQDVTAAAV